MIWISNEIAHIDPAYLRRFAFLLEVKNPSRTVRRRIARRAFGSLIPDEKWIERIAEHEAPAPGQLSQAARVTRLAGEQIDPACVAERTLRAGMRALNKRPARDFTAAMQFDLGYLNCSADVATLVRTSRRGRRER
jgi:transitional endoplasmic reticulum ATPase